MTSGPRSTRSRTTLTLHQLQPHQPRPWHHQRPAPVYPRRLLQSSLRRSPRSSSRSSSRTSLRARRSRTRASSPPCWPRLGPLADSPVPPVHTTLFDSTRSCSQEKQVAHDSPEAVAYFASRPATAQAVPASSSASTAASASLDALFGPDEPAPASVSKSASPAPVPQPPPAPPKPSGGGAPVRRKAGGGGLAAMSASLAKPPKLNTLEKSKMDWNQWVWWPSSLRRQTDFLGAPPGSWTRRSSRMISRLRARVDTLKSKTFSRCVGATATRWVRSRRPDCSLPLRSAPKTSATNSGKRARVVGGEEKLLMGCGAWFLSMFRLCVGSNVIVTTPLVRFVPLRSPLPALHRHARADLEVMTS